MVDDNKQAAKNAARSAAELKKQKKKKWCPIITSEHFNSRVIGESLLDDASMLMNRTVTVNMMQLTGDMKKQNMNIMFKVTDVKDGKGLAQAVRFSLSPSSLRRLARREKDKLSDSFVVKTLDGKLVRIKPVMVTNNMTKGSVSTALIKTCRIICKEFINKIAFEQLVVDLVSYKFQKEVRDALHTTYPLRNLEIRMMAIETKKKKESVEEEELLKLKRQQELAAAEKKEQQESEQSSRDQAEIIDQVAEIEGYESNAEPSEDADSDSVSEDFDESSDEESDA